MKQYCFKGFFTDCSDFTIKYIVFATKGNNVNGKDKDVKNALLNIYYEELLREFEGVE